MRMDHASMGKSQILLKGITRKNTGSPLIEQSTISEAIKLASSKSERSNLAANE